MDLNLCHMGVIFCSSPVIAANYGQIETSMDV